MSPFRIAVLSVALACIPATAETLLVAPRPGPAALAAQAEVVILGKVVEIEAEAVDAPAFAGAPRDVKAQFKVAVVRVEEAVLGGKGRTQFRVGFPADAPPAADPSVPAAPPAGPGLPGGGRIARPTRAVAVALTVGMDGCFFLSPYAGADFFVAEGGVPLEKKREAYAKQLEEVRQVAKAIEDPVAALKAKALTERFQAARAILQRYQAVRPGRQDREPVPAEENRLLLDLLAELPWAPAGGAADAPSRSALWPLVRPTELGFQAPKVLDGNDYNKVMEDATTAFLKGNRDRMKIRRYAR